MDSFRRLFVYSGPNRPLHRTYSGGLRPSARAGERRRSATKGQSREIAS